MLRIAHGNITTWYSTAFQPAASASRAVMAPQKPGRGRTGAGPGTSRASRPRTRARSSRPKPRAAVVRAARTGRPNTVTKVPTPMANSVTAVTKPRIATGRPVSV